MHRNLDNGSHQSVYPAGVYPTAVERESGDELDLRRALTVLRRRWKAVVLVLVPIVGAAWFWQGTLPPRYTAEGLLQKKTEESPLRDIGAGFLPRANEEMTAGEIEIIRSRGVLGPAVDSLGLRIQLDSDLPRSAVLAEALVAPEAGRGAYEIAFAGNRAILLSASGRKLDEAPLSDWLDGPGFRLKLAARFADPIRFRLLRANEAVDQLRRNLVLAPIGRTQLIRLRFTNTDPQLTADVINVVASQYQKQAAITARENAKRRREFLAAQLAQVADSLAAAQEIQLNYQESSGIVDPNIEGQALITAALDAEKEIRTLTYQETLLTALNRALSSPGQVDEALRRTVAIGNDLVPGAENLFGRLQELQSQRSRLTASRFGSTESGPNVEVIDSLIAATKAEMRALSAQALNVLSAKRRAAEERGKDLQAELRTLPGRSTGFTRVRQSADAVQSTFALIAEKYYEAQIAEAVEGGDVDIVEEAVAPDEPNPARTNLIMTLAFLSGLILGAAIAFTREHLDRRIRSAEDAEQATGMPVLTRVPHARRARAGVSRLIMVDEERTAMTEAFRTLRTMVRFSRSTLPRVISVTSAGPSEGKSTVASNFAITAASEGARVLLIDADLPRPVQHDVFGVTVQPGLTDVLVGDANEATAVRRIEERNLDVLPSGTRVPNGAQLISGSNFKRMLDQWREHYDTIVIDTPPALLVSDATILAKLADGVIVVVRSNVTDRAGLAAALQQLERVESPVLGLVLNDVSRTDNYSSYKYGAYSYAYGLRENGTNGARHSPNALDRVRRVFSGR